MTLPLALLAGGKGTRLGGIASSTPKSMVEVAGRPFIDWVLRSLRDRGLQRIVICTGHLGNTIRDFVGDGARYGLSCGFSDDGPRELGTAGAVKQAIPLLGTSFFVQYGDTLLDLDYSEVAAKFLTSGRRGMMTVAPNDDGTDASNVEMLDGRLVRYDKRSRDERMRHIDFGLGVFRAMAFDNIMPGESSDLATLFQSLLADGELAAFETRAQYREIGTPAARLATEQFLLTTQLTQ